MLRIIYTYAYKRLTRDDNAVNKSKEMVLGCLTKQPAGVIERVTTFKLLGITLSSDLSWLAHINAICAKVAPRLYYLKQLRDAPGYLLVTYCISI